MTCPCTECNSDPTAVLMHCHGGKAGYPHGHGGPKSNTPFTRPEWEALVPVTPFPVDWDWVVRDHPGGFMHYTHQPSGEKLEQYSYYRPQDMLEVWRRKRDEFFGKLAPHAFIVTPDMKYVGQVYDVIGFNGFDR